MKNTILSLINAECPWGDTLHWFDTVDSTNTRAKAMAASGAPHGTVLIAGHQSGGRGRLGRQFLSPAGMGIYLSVILRPDCAPARLMHLTCAAGVAVCNAIESAAGFRPGIKWTNDLVWEGRKLGGILTELGLSTDGTVSYAVVGIGINCGQAPQDFDPQIRDMAQSLSGVRGKDVDRAMVAAALITSLYRMSQRLFSEKEQLMACYRADCVTLGKDISLHRSDDIRHGKALDIDADGGLIVRFADGHTETVASGEVSIRGMYGYA